LRLPIKQFTVWTFYGSIPRCLFLGYLGWGLGESYQAIAKGIDRVETMVSMLLSGLIFALILWLRLKVRGNILKSD